MRPFDTLRHMLLESVYHHITAFLVNLADGLDMFIEVAAMRNFMGYDLVEGGGMQVCALFCLDQFGDHFRRGNHPCQADARRECLSRTC